MPRAGSSITRLLHVSALILTGILLGPALAHVFEMPGKLRLGHDDYLLVQQIYRGWALFAVPISLNLAIVAFLAFRTRGTGTGAWCLAALLCLLASQVVFWVWTYPANAATSQWTLLPDAWEQLRRQWEFSHAAGAVFTMTAFVCLALMPTGQAVPHQSSAAPPAA